MKLPEGYIVFYDGLCPLCNAVVRKLLAYDKKEQMYFASLQSPLAEEFLKERRIENEDSVLLWRLEIERSSGPCGCHTAGGTHTCFFAYSCFVCISVHSVRCGLFVPLCVSLCVGGVTCALHLLPGHPGCRTSRDITVACRV